MTVTDEQAAVCKRFGSVLSVPTSDLKVGIAFQTLDAIPLNALRHRPEAGTCGWYIWGGEHFSQAPDFFQPLHVAHLDEYCPKLLPYLGLAPGWRVLLALDYQDVWYDESLLKTEA
jgi:hypothetical protein